LNPKFAMELSASLRELRVRGTSVPIPKFVSIRGSLARTSESIRTLASNMLASAAFEPEVRNGAFRKLARTSGSRH
jgi:hypothetical protein